MSSWFLVLLLLAWVVTRKLYSVYLSSAADSVLNNIPGPKSTSFVFGSIKELLGHGAWDYSRYLYETYGDVILVKSFFGINILCLSDPLAVKYVHIQDQTSYEATPNFLLANDIIFGPSLLSSEGVQHKKRRKQLNAIFAPTHLRNMVPAFYPVARRLRDALEQKASAEAVEVDVLSWLTRATLEGIGQSCIGYSFEPLVERREPHPFSTSVKSLIPSFMAPSLMIARSLLLPVLVKLPNGARRVGSVLVRVLRPWDSLQRLNAITEVMYTTSQTIYREKNAAFKQASTLDGGQAGGQRNVLGILLGESLRAPDDQKMSEAETIAQISSLIFAAMDSTSGTLARILHILATRPDVQDRLRQEIVTSKGEKGDLNHDELLALSYLDAVYRETSRLYLPVLQSQRITTRDTSLPLSKPVKGLNGEMISEIPLRKGSLVLISNVNMNCSPEIWGPDSYDWKPERWLRPLPHAVEEARTPGVVPHLMTFAAGPRSCIGFKFAELQIKVLVSVLVESFQFSLSDKEIVWQATAVLTPKVVGGGGLDPHLPLLLKSLKEKRS